MAFPYEIKKNNQMELNVSNLEEAYCSLNLKRGEFTRQEVALKIMNKLKLEFPKDPRENKRIEKKLIETIKNRLFNNKVSFN